MYRGWKLPSFAERIHTGCDKRETEAQVLYSYKLTRHFHYKLSTGLAPHLKNVLERKNKESGLPIATSLVFVPIAMVRWYKYSMRKEEIDTCYPCHIPALDQDDRKARFLMYFLYKEIQKAVGAKLCCVAHFFDDQEENIVTCSSDTMIVYSVVRLTELTPEELESNIPPFRLKVVGQYSFSGEILSIAPIPFHSVSPYGSGPKRDALVLSFKGYYVSIIVFDDQNGDLLNVSCYDFHKDAVIALDSIFPSFSEM